MGVELAVGALVSGIAQGSLFSAAATSIFSVTAFASSLVLGGVSSLLSKKREKGGVTDIKSSGYTRQFRQSIVPREVVYGEIRRSGGLAFIGQSSDNKYLHYIILLAAHEIGGVDEIIIDQESYHVDDLSSDIVQGGQYDGLIKVQFRYGTDDQTALPDMVSDLAEWTTDHRLQGIAYAYVKLEYNQDKFPSGIPNFSFWLRGRKVYDTRDFDPV